MIGGVNMNTKKNLMVLLLCFFSFFMFAGEKLADQLTFDIGVGESGTYHKYDFSNCSASKNGYVIVSVMSDKGLKFETTSSAVSGKTDSATCDYTYKRAGKPETKKITVNFNIIAQRQITINLGLTADGYDPTKNIAEEFLPDGATIVGHKVNLDGAEFITVDNCKGTVCNVSISQEGESLASDGATLTAGLDVIYKIPGSDEEHKIDVILLINAVSGARAYPGSSGVCDFGTDWKNRTWVDASNKTYRFWQSKSDSSVLPSCDSSKSKIPIEFKGWLKGTDHDYVMAIGECSGALPAGSSVEDGENYTACYERTPYVQISPATGNVPMADGWEALKGNSGYYYASTSSDSVTLPELIFAGIHKNDELEYWYNSADPSQQKQSGDSVPLDGSIWIAVVNTKVSDGWKDLYKTVKVEQTVPLVVEGISNCTSSSSYVNVNYVGGECQVSGVEATPDDTYADVVVTVNGETVTYKFNVEKSMSANVIVDDTIKTNLGTNSEVTNEQSWYEENCTSFEIQGSSVWDNYTKDGSMTGTIYQVSQACGLPGNQGYYAFCLDPGRRGPSGVLYTRTDDLDGTGGAEMLKLVDIFVSKYDDFSMLDDPYSPVKKAFHIALRAVAILAGVSSYTTPEDRVFASHYEWYADIAEHIRTGDIDYVNRINLVDGVAGPLYEILNEYIYADNIENEKFERTVSSTETVSYGEAGYKITYKGLIIAPSTVTSIESLTNDTCTSIGLTSCTAELTENTDEAVALQYEGRKVYNYVVTIIAEDAGVVDPPENDEEKKNASFKVNYTGRYVSKDVAIAAPASGDILQRMFVFNVEQSDVLVYFSVVPTSCDMPSLDYKAHCNADSCDSEFNEELFMAAGCCRLVTDEIKYKYIIDNLCSGDPCTVSTMSSVCGLNSDNLGSAELYEIREGAKWENGGYVDQIGTCLVNVTEDYSVEKIADFQMKDKAGNTLNVSEYSNNRYCQVSCGENWQISLESFGNFVGEHAVAAGTYFSTTNSDIFIGGSRTCYTTYIDYDKYMKDLVEQSDKAITAYNLYSEASHIWTDTDEQSGSTLEEPVTYNVCIASKSLGEVWSGSYESYSYDPGSVSSDPSYTVNYESTCCTGSGENRTCDDCIKTSTVSACAEYGSFVEYQMTPQGTSTDGKEYDFYTNKVSDNGTSNNVTKQRKKYDNTEYFTCKDGYVGPSEGASDASVTCKLSGYNGKDGLETICNSNGDNGFCVQNDSGDRDEAYEQIKETVQKKATEIMDAQSAVSSSAVNTIHGYSEQLFKCQHFELYNTSDDEKVDENGNEYANNEISTGSYLDHTNEKYLKINTQFNPHVAYEYDEEEFMTILGRDNVLVEYTKKNDEVWGGTYATATNESKDSQVNAYHSRNNSIPVDSSEVQLSRNDISTHYYNTSGKFSGEDINTYGGESGSETPTTESKKLVFCIAGSSSRIYSPTLANDEWTEGLCYQMDIEYIKAHYIKSSIANSSFYKNKGYWYINAGDLKEHGDNKEDALQKANKREDVNYNINEEIQNNRWWPYGTDNREEGINVFPIGLDTPRNLYLYSYEFGDIGSYMDGKVGRLMGDEASLIKLNTRTCFYEVYEELCLCCGSTISTYVENSGTVNDYIEAHKDKVTYKPSDSDSMNINENGVISFATSTVNLGDLNSDSDRVLGNNWGDSQFLYSGDLYQTSKGGELLQAIQSQGENVYSDEPEYSYYLTPSTLSAIRDYNDQYGYEVNYNNLRVYGSYAIRSLCDNDSASNDCWEVGPDDEYISFQHYGSSFLEDYMPELGAAYSGLLTENEVNGSCFVMAGEANNMEKIQEKVDSGCRWVDYVQEADGKYFRLAFK